MARPPETDPKASTKQFVVAPGFSIGGFDGKRKDEGELITLTHEQAKHYLALGAIELELPDFDDDEDEDDKDKKGTDDGRPQPAPKPADSGPAKAGSGAKA